jgi:tRNA threonylcarbamoyladenosine biosynthesis protein TsaB
VREPASAQHVLGTIDRLLRDCALELKDLDRIVVGRGPGSFTGLRVGIATAQGLAAPNGIELLGATTTAALRRAAGPAAVAMVDARRGEVFVEGPGLPLTACAPADLTDRLAPGTMLVGDGAVRYRDFFPDCVIPEDASPLHVPDAAALAAVAADGEPATPVYARAPDAVPTEQR